VIPNLVTGPAPAERWAFQRANGEPDLARFPAFDRRLGRWPIRQAEEPRVVRCLDRVAFQASTRDVRS
jgi:hypothetical protein